MPAVRITLIQVLKDFVWLWIAVATILAFYFGLAVAGLLRVFWVVLVIVVALVAAKYLLLASVRKIRHVAGIYRKGKSYDELLRVSEANKLRAAELAGEVADGLTRGLLEGRARVVGELLAASTQTGLRIVSMRVVEDQLHIAAAIAEGDPPPAIGGAWRLLSKGQSVAYAVFTVMEVDTAGDVTYVRLQQGRVLQPDFIADLKERASKNPDVGDVWELRPRTVNSLDELAKEPDHE